MSKKTVLVLAFLLSVGLLLSAQEKIISLTEQEKGEAIEKICTLLNRFYVFPEVAARMEARLKARQVAGAFHEITSPKEFADAVTGELRSISGDKHTGLFFGPNPDLQPREDQALKRLQARIDRERGNYGLAKVEILPGNVGYMGIKTVMFYEPVKALLSAAMAFLSNSDAIIFDLRDNRGGDPQYMAYLFSYFFDRPTHLTSIYWRDRDRTVESWTTESVPGKKMTDVPLFVVINKATFSGAEEFAYDLQSRRRAIIVGEVSAGGANPASSFVVYKDLRISISLGRAINPVTGTNWEGVGVKPDVEAPPEAALTAAAELAREAALRFGESKKSRLTADLAECRESLAQAARLFEANNKAGGEALAVSALNKALARDLFTQADINRLGYDSLEQKGYRMAIAVFKHNAAAFPRSANAFDSLGEAYLRSGDKDKARESYRKALAIDPNLASARQALEKL